MPAAVPSVRQGSLLNAAPPAAKYARGPLVVKSEKASVGLRSAVPAGVPSLRHTPPGPFPGVKISAPSNAP